MISEHCFETYCTGCGLCHSVIGTKMKQDDKGFLAPTAIRDVDIEFMKRTCMVSGAFWKNTSEFKVWGDCLRDPFYAYSNDPDLRRRASSGGVVSQIAIYLLENHLVDGVIETKVSEESQIETEATVTMSSNDIINCSGSRYTISSPLIRIMDQIETGKKYVFIGKPCDVMALRNLKKHDQQINSSIPYLISFMCAGIPSKQAEHRLLSALNSNVDDCKELTYRGNGWPGFTVATSNNGERKQMTYAESWGKILGRDVATVCRFCYDGIGTAADISCGDGWYIKDGKPDFEEHEGRNIVFIRTEVGNELFNKMIGSNVISCEKASDPYEELKIIQNYQYTRRTTMREKLFALKLYGRPIPAYSRSMMRQLGKKATVNSRARILMGTLKRLHENKI